MGNRKEHRWRATLAFLLAMLLSTTLYATPAHAQSGPSSSTPDDAVREDVGFYVRAQIPENQIDKRLSYFDLRMAPEQRQSLFVEVVNTSGCDIQVCVEANTARTSRHGIIEYTNSTAYDETLRVPFSDIAEVRTPLLNIPANSSAVAEVELTMPKQSLEGSALGGIVVREQPEGKTEQPAEGIHINNQFAYVVAVHLRESEVSPEPDLALIDVRPEIVDYLVSPVHYIQNPTPVILADMRLALAVYREGRNDPVLEHENDLVSMAPNSVMAYSPSYNGGIVEPGEYRSVLTMEWQGREWHFEETFSIEPSDAADLNESAIAAPRETPPWWLFVILGLLVVVLLLVAIVVAQRRRLRGQNRPVYKRSHKARRFFSFILTLCLLPSAVLSVRAAGEHDSDATGSQIDAAALSDAGSTSSEQAEESAAGSAFETPPASESSGSEDGTGSVVREAPPDEEESQDVDPESAISEDPDSEEDEPVPEDVASEEALEQIEIAPLLVEIDSSTVIVETAQELVDAVGGANAYTTIYLGADITMSGGIPLAASKSSVTISGTPPDGARYRFVNTSTDGSTNTFVTSAGQTLTLLDMDCQTSNLYGLVTGGGTAVFSGIAYTGRQLAWMETGTLTIRDSDITVSDQELCESVGVRFEGLVKVTKTGSSNAVIWMRAVGEVRVAAGADVTINTASYFVYSGDYRISFVVEDGAGFFLTTSTSNFVYEGQVLASFSVGANSVFRFQNNSSSTLGSLRTIGPFSVGSGAVFEVSTLANAPSLRFGLNSVVTFDDPARASIYTASGRPLQFDNGGTYTLRAGSINAWQSAAEPAEAARPDNFWNKADGSLCEFNYSVSSGTLSTNLTASDPIDSLPTTGNFNIANMQLLVIGRYSLTVDTVTNSSTTVSGASSNGAALTVAYTATDGTAQTGSGQATGLAYSLNLSLLPQLGSNLTVTSALNQVWARKTTVVQNADNYALQLSVPPNMPFGTQAVAPQGTLYSRLDGVWSITVTDDRIDKTAWTLGVAVASPLGGSDVSGTPRTYVGALVYTSQGAVSVLGNEAFPVFTQQANGPQQTNVNFASDEGVLIQAPPQTLYAGSYNATLLWSIMYGP